ncbi:MAG: PKD domain-containing protein [Salibacteraceae bacterium]
MRIHKFFGLLLAGLPLISTLPASAQWTSYPTGMNGPTQLTACEANHSTYQVAYADSEDYVSTLWNNQLVDISQSFTLDFEIQFSNDNEGADGIVFTMGDPAGGNFVGGDGGNLGINNYNHSISVEFDVFGNQTGGYYNDLGFRNDSPDHAALFFNGDFSNAAPGSPIATGELEDGAVHHVTIDWNPCLPKGQRLQVTLDHNLLIDHTEDMIGNYLNGMTNVRWGFTAATGDNTSNIIVCTPNALDTSACSPCDTIINSPDFLVRMNCNKGAFSDLSTATGGNFALVRWLWGDGSPDETALPGSTTDHTFPGPGTYTVCLVMENYVGGVCCHDTLCQTVIIVGDCDDIPNPQFTVAKLDAPCTKSGDCCVTTQFQNQVSFPPSQVIWDWGDGTSTLLNGPNFNGLHNYSQSGGGLYNITVTAIYHPPCLKGVCCIKTSSFLYQLTCSSVIIDPSNPGGRGSKLERLAQNDGELPSSTSQMNVSQLRVYPQPLHRSGETNLFLEVPGVSNQALNVVLTDMQGRIVLRQTVQQGTMPLAIELPASAPAGIYLLQVFESEQLLGTTKVVLSD